MQDFVHSVCIHQEFPGGDNDKLIGVGIHKARDHGIVLVRPGLLLLGPVEHHSRLPGLARSSIETCVISLSFAKGKRSGNVSRKVQLLLNAPINTDGPRRKIGQAGGGLALDPVGLPVRLNKPKCHVNYSSVLNYVDIETR
jgi:hypothetical protein